VQSVILPKTGIKPARIRLTVILLSVMFAGYISGCVQAPTFIPEEFSGKYITTHPGYEDHYFELYPGFIIMRLAGGTLKFYNVRRVEKRVITRRTLYTVLCVNEARGEEFNFAFFADLAGEGVIYFKNKPEVLWEKQRNRPILHR
jgi:hypothetical protein